MKKLILSLFVGLFGFINFGYCNVSYDSIELLTIGPNNNLGAGKEREILPGECFIINYYGNKCGLYDENHNFVVTGSSNYSTIYCFSATGYIKNGHTSSTTLNFYDFSSFNSSSSCDPQYTSEECQSVYGLVSSGALSVCENSLDSCQSDYISCQSSLSGCLSNTSGFNNLLNECHLSLNACNSSLSSCLQANCPDISYTGSDMIYSNLYINNILHPGRENIFIDIPDYIYWDYSVDTGDFNLYVGSGYDQDYIDGILSINSYKPSSEDFTQVFVSGLTLIFPYIFVALFIIFVWKLLKRVFK